MLNLFRRKNKDIPKTVEVVEINSAPSLLKRIFTPKNVVILVLLVALAISLIVASAKYREIDDMRRNFDTLFAQTYNELIINSRNGEISYSKDSYTAYDVDNAKKGKLLVTLFPYTDYEENDSLRQIILILNDYIGEHRMYPTKPYSELPKDVYDGLFELSRDFGDEKLSKKVLTELKDALA